MTELTAFNISILIVLSVLIVRDNYNANRLKKLERHVIETQELDQKSFRILITSFNSILERLKRLED